MSVTQTRPEQGHPAVIAHRNDRERKADHDFTEQEQEQELKVNTELTKAIDALVKGPRLI